MWIGLYNSGVGTFLNFVRNWKLCPDQYLLICSYEFDCPLYTMFTYDFAQNFVRTSPDVRICSYTPGTRNVSFGQHYSKQICPNFDGSDSKGLTRYWNILSKYSLGYKNLSNFTWYTKNSKTVTRLNMTKEDENSIQLIPTQILQGFSTLWLIGAVMHACIGINWG